MLVSGALALPASWPLAMGSGGLPGEGGARRSGSRRNASQSICGLSPTSFSGSLCRVPGPEGKVSTSAGSD